MARTTLGRNAINVFEVARRHTVFRIVRTDNVDDPVLESSFRSNYELGEPPRKAELRSAVIHRGVSMYIRSETAHTTAQRWPAIGDFVAEVVLTSGNGFNIAQTGHPMHVTVWGDPLKLCEAVVDIVPVEE